MKGMDKQRIASHLWALVVGGACFYLLAVALLDMVQRGFSFRAWSNLLFLTSVCGMVGLVLWHGYRPQAGRPEFSSEEVADYDDGPSIR